MTNEQPEQWAVELWRDVNNQWFDARDAESGTAAAVRFLQRAFAERTAELVAENAKLRKAADAQPVAVQGLVEALKRIADERTLQSDLPGLPWTAQDIAALQSREIVLMRDIATDALTAYQEQCDAE